MIDFIKQIANLSYWEFTLFFIVSVVSISVFIYVFDTIVELIKGRSSEPNSKSDEKTEK